MEKYESNKLSLAHVELGELLKEARKKAGYSQGEIATMFGYSSSQFISNIERNVAPIPMNMLIALCDLYGLDWSKIVKVVTKAYENQLKLAYKKTKKGRKKVK